MENSFRKVLLGLSLLVVPAVASAQPTQTVFSFSDGNDISQLVLNGSSSFTAERGWYENTGSSNGIGQGNNFISGTCGPVACDGRGEVWRNYFRFDLNNFTAPVTSAVLRLGNGATGYYNELGSYLGYNLFDITGEFSELGLASSLAFFDDLGSGVMFGSTTVTSAENGTIIEIALNADALNSINNARQSGFWALGGNIDNAAVSTVPEPSTYVLMLAGLAAIAVGARAKRRVR